MTCPDGTSVVVQKFARWQQGPRGNFGYRQEAALFHQRAGATGNLRDNRHRPQARKWLKEVGFVSFDLSGGEVVTSNVSLSCRDRR